jgi:hypothetical protein|tara:strand:+ start:550 stop:669 length:120 start_codon:yes stop_codon:yes gene_type:complete
MSSDDIHDYVKIIMFLAFVFGIMIFASCDGGWSIAGYEV